MADYAPISLAQVPQLIGNGLIPVVVAIIQVSLPDGYGYASFGISVDNTR
jgi:acyl-CoA hydrolase